MTEVSGAGVAAGEAQYQPQPGRQSGDRQAAECAQPAKCARPPNHNAAPPRRPARAQRWKSNPMHWCDLCKCWMNDTKAARLNHERGAKHQDNLARSKWQSRRRASGGALGCEDASATAGHSWACGPGWPP